MTSKAHENIEIIQVRYYNVIFSVIFQKGLDDYKMQIFLDKINTGSFCRMKDIYEWCQKQSILVRTKFEYRKEFSKKANMWNFYSYYRFLVEKDRY